MRRFAGLELTEDTIPDESMLLRFRNLLERHQLTQAIFAEVRSLLKEALLLKSGTIVNATIIEAPPSTENAEQARDPKM
jgi:IS5 family transposase